MKKIFTILIITLLFSSCKKEQDKVGFYVDRGVEISVEDKFGNDLLNPTNPGAFLYENIKIYYLLDGIKKEINQANLDHPKNFMLYEINSKYQMRLFLNCSDKKGSITYVQWNETDIDTFKTDISDSTPNLIVTKLWYNDSLVWNVYDFTPDNFRGRAVNIIK